MSNIEARSFLESVTGFGETRSGSQMASSDRPVRLATIDPYFTGGMPSVVFDGETTATVKGYSWADGYTPSAGDRVYLIPVGQSYIIGGKLRSKLAYPQFYKIPSFNAGMVNFDVPETNYANVRVTRSATGVVHLSGMANPNGTISAGTLLFTLPTPFRPTRTIVFPVNCNNRYAKIRVEVSGNVRVDDFGSYLDAGYVSFDNITYNNDPGLVWMDATVASGFTANAGFTNPTPGYAKDIYNRVWWRGSVSPNTAPVGEASIITGIPVGYRPFRQQHMLNSVTGGFANLDVTDTGIIHWKANNDPNSTFFSFQNVHYIEGTQTGWTDLGLMNGWVNNDIGQPYAGYYKDAEGYVHLRGLVRGGTIVGTIGVLPAGFRPRKILIRATVAANAMARVDIDPSGGIVAVSGSNAWFSLDGITFAAEQ